MNVRPILVVVLLGLAACGGLAPDDGGKCKYGEATNVSISGIEGAPGTMDMLCASGTPDSLRMTIDSGELGYFQLYTGNGLVQADGASCSDGEFEVDVVTQDSDSNWGTNYEGDSSLSSMGVSCQFTASQASSERIAGHFEGRLLRSAFAGDGKKFIEVSFDYWIKVSPESEY